MKYYQPSVIGIPFRYKLGLFLIGICIGTSLFVMFGWGSSSTVTRFGNVVRTLGPFLWLLLLFVEYVWYVCRANTMGPSSPSPTQQRHHSVNNISQQITVAPFAHPNAHALPKRRSGRYQRFCRLIFPPNNGNRFRALSLTDRIKLMAWAALLVMVEVGCFAYCQVISSQIGGRRS
jgi:hypothetical protein